MHIQTKKIVSKVLMWEINSESKCVKFCEELRRVSRVNTGLPEDRIYEGNFDFSKLSAADLASRSWVLMLLGGRLGVTKYDAFELFTDFTITDDMEKVKKRSEIIINTAADIKRVIIEVPLIFQEAFGVGAYIRTKMIPPAKISSASNSALMARGIDPEGTAHYGSPELDFGSVVFQRTGFDVTAFVAELKKPKNKFKVWCYRDCVFQEVVPTFESSNSQGDGA